MRGRHSGGSEKTWSVRGEGAINPGKVSNKACRDRGRVSAVLRPRGGRMDRGRTTLKGWRPFGKVRVMDASGGRRARGGEVGRDGAIRGREGRVIKVGEIT